MGTVILDGNNIAFRSWKAMDNDSLTNGGDNVSVIFGFLKSLNTTLRLRNIPNDKVVIVWDIGRSKKRMDIYPDYKGNREYDDTFQDFITQADKLKEILKSLPFYQLQLKGYEGDDLIAAVCYLLEDHKKVIVTADKDLAQLIDGNTFMYKLGMYSSDHKLITPVNFVEVEKKCVIPFNKSLDYKVLKGDTSDNIPGVTGVGDKTIEKLFKKYGGLSEALDHPEELQEDSYFKRILKHPDIMIRNYKLMDLRKCLDDKILMYVGNELLVKKFYNELQLKKHFMEYNFQSFITKYERFIEPFIIPKGDR